MITGIESARSWSSKNRPRSSGIFIAEKNSGVTESVVSGMLIRSGRPSMLKEAEFGRRPRKKVVIPAADWIPGVCASRSNMRS